MSKELSDLLRKYGNSLPDIKMLLPQLFEAFEQKELEMQGRAAEAFETHAGEAPMPAMPPTRVMVPAGAPDLQYPTSPTDFTREEALSIFGLELDEGWSLRYTPPVNGTEAQLLLLSPEGWTVNNQNIWTSPDGDEFTVDELALLGDEIVTQSELPELGDWVIGQYDAERPVPEGELAPPGLTDEELLFWEYVRTGGDLDIDDWSQQGAPLRPGGEEMVPGITRDDFLTAVQTVFPDTDIAQLFQSMQIDEYMPPGEQIRAEQAQADFLNAIAEYGETPETIAILQGLGMSPEDIELFFPPTEPEIVTELWREYMPDWFVENAKTEAQFEEAMTELAEIAPGDNTAVDAWLEKWIPTTGAVHKRQILNIVGREHRDYSFYAKLQLSMGAGVGDIVSGIGGALSWLGHEDVGDKLTEIGTSMARELTVETDLGDFDWLDLLDPDFYATQVARAVPFAMMLMPLAVGGFIAGSAAATALGAGKIASWIAGTLVGTALSRPAESAIEAGQAYQEAIDIGLSEEEASGQAREVFTKNMTLAGADAWEIAIALIPTPKWVPQALVVRGLVRTVTVAGKVLIVGLSQGGEELLQEMIQRHAAGEDFEMDAISQGVFAIGMMMGAGMGLGGDVVSNLMERAKGDMSPVLEADFEALVNALVEQGVPENQAMILALEDMASNPETADIIESIVTSNLEEMEAEGVVAEEAATTTEAEEGAGVVPTEVAPAEAVSQTAQEIRTQAAAALAESKVLFVSDVQKIMDTRNIPAEVQARVNDLVDTMLDYVAVANNTATEAQINEMAERLLPNVERHIERLREVTPKQKLYKQAQELATRLEEYKVGLTGTRQEKVISIDQIMPTSHRVEQSALPQMFGIPKKLAEDLGLGANTAMPKFFNALEEGKVAMAEPAPPAKPPAKKRTPAKKPAAKKKPPARRATRPAPEAPQAPTPIIEQHRQFTQSVQRQVTEARQKLTRVTGEEARVSRETLKGLERELKYAQRTLENFSKRADLPEANVLRSTIMGWSRMKGLPKHQLRSIISSVAGRRQLRVVPQEQLVKILDRVKEARPKRLNNRLVVTAETESRIQNLKETLIRQKQLTEKGYNQLLQRFGLTTDRYENFAIYITEGEAKSLLRAMNDEAVIAEWDIMVAEKMEKNPVLKEVYDSMQTRGTTGSGVSFNDEAIHIKRGNELLSMRFYMLDLQKKLGAPVYDLWQRINMAHLSLRANEAYLINRLEASTTQFKAIVTNPDALKRIENWIAAENKASGVKRPANITEEELKLARELQTQLKEFQSEVRYVRFMEEYAGHGGEADGIAKDIPDAPKASINRAIKIYETKGAAALKEFLDTQTWGVIESGYNPLAFVKPRLYQREPRATTFAKGHIETRTGTEFTQDDTTIMERYQRYIRQMFSLRDIAPMARVLDRVFTENATKLDRYRPVANVIARGINEMKGYREDGGLINHSLERMYAQVASTVFWRPDLVLRNKFQNFAFNPDFHAGRFLDPRNKPMSKERKAWFEWFVSQQKGIEQDYLLKSTKPFKPFGIPMDRLMELAHKTSLYPWSDKSNRAEAFWVRMNRVDRALEQYHRDGDVKKLINASGLNEFEPRQQAEALEYLVQDKVDYGVRGMPAVTGEEAFARYVGQQLVNNVHFLYDRSQRAPAEMGATGKTLGNILVFSRSWGERFYLQSRKITDPKVSMREKVQAARIVVGILVAGIAMGEAYKRITGKTNNPYNPLNILTWTPGGLIIGTAEDISNTMYLITQAAQGDKGALGSLPSALSGLATITLPFYKNIVQGLSAATNKKNVDVWAMRKIREMLDEEYEVRGGTHEVERSLVEALQIGLLGGRDKPQTIEEKIADAESNLGNVIDDVDAVWSIEEPDYYTTRSLSGEYARIFGDTEPADILKEDYNPLVNSWANKEAAESVYYSYPSQPLYKLTSIPEEWAGNVSRRELELLKKYWELPESERAAFLEEHPELTVDKRDQWLIDNPEENAMLALWGVASIKTMEAYNIMQKMIVDLDLPDEAVPPQTLPPEGSVANYFKYQEIVAEFGANSYEAQQLLLQDDVLRQWLERDPITRPQESLDILVANRDIMDEYEGYGDPDSPFYIEDKDERADARLQLKLDYPEYVDDMRRVEVFDEGGTSDQADLWVERGHLVDEFTAGSSEVKVWLLDHPEFHQWCLENDLLSDDGSDWNEFSLRYNVRWRDLEERYNELPTDGDAREKFLERHPEYARARIELKARTLESPTGQTFTEEQVSQYISYYELPDKGYRRERYLLENPEFAQAMHDITGMLLPDPADVPAVQYDEITEQYQAQFDQLDGLSDVFSPYYVDNEDERSRIRNELRFNEDGSLTDFGVAEIRRKAYKNMVPEEYVNNYVDYYSIITIGKPEGQDLWFDDDWYLIENPDFYENVYLGVLGLKPKDLEKVPSKKVWNLYLIYSKLPAGNPRFDFRARNPELDAWLVLYFDMTPIGDRGDSASEPTPWELQAQAENFLELFEQWFD